MERDVLRHKPDLVLLDFSANNGVTTADKETLSSYEAIVRRLVTEVPVVQVSEKSGRRLGFFSIRKSDRDYYHCVLMKEFLIWNCG